MPGDVKSLVEQMVRAVVRHPDGVAVKALRGERSVLIEIRTAPEDTGLLIGRKGNTIRAIRHLASVVGSLQGQRVQVAVLDSEGNNRGRRSPAGEG